MLDCILLLAVLTFPAYGAPVPGAVTTVSPPGVPARVTLCQAIAIAAGMSPQLAQARAALRLSNVAVSQAAAPGEPSLAGQLSYIGGNVASGALGTVQRSAVLTLQQLLFDGGRVISQVRAARLAARGASETYERQLQTLTFTVAQAYYGALQAEGQVRLGLDLVQQDDVQERLIAAQIRAGTAAPVDLKTAEIPTAQARVAVVRSQGAALAAQAAFAAVLGLPANADVAPIETAASSDTSTLPAGTPLDYAVAANRALALRPDYLSAITAARAAAESVRADRLAHSPALSLVSQAGYQSFGNAGASLTSVASIGAAASIPLFDQGVTNAAADQAAALQQQDAAVMEQLQLTVQADVREALVELVAAREALAQTADELQKAREVLEATQLQYRAGQTSLPLLLNAQTQLAGAENDRLNATYQLRQSEQAYLYALGENDLADAPNGGVR